MRRVLFRVAIQDYNQGYHTGSPLEGLLEELEPFIVRGLRVRRGPNSPQPKHIQVCIRPFEGDQRLHKTLPLSLGLWARQRWARHGALRRRRPMQGCQCRLHAKGGPIQGERAVLGGTAQVLWLPVRTPSCEERPTS